MYKRALSCVLISAFQFVIGILVVSEDAAAQSRWEIPAFMRNPTGEYFLYSLSCYGEHCTACGQYALPNFSGIKPVVLYSEDGGVTWITQDPSLPAPLRNYPLRVAQQINDQTAVVAGDTGLISMTTDGGASWHLRSGPLQRIQSIHFSDPRTGIVGVGDDTGIYITSDAGLHWSSTPFKGGFLWQVHSYGNGMFRAFKFGNGPLYTTHDNWQTVDSTLIFDLGVDSNKNLLLRYCTFGIGDMMIVHGIDNNTSSALFYRTVDAQHWIKSPHFSQLDAGGVFAISPLTHDTIIAGGDIWSQKLLLSTDRGVSWRADTLQYDTAYASSRVASLARTSRGYIGLFAISPFMNHSVLALLPKENLGVEIYERIGMGTRIFPNPSNSNVTVHTSDGARRIHIMDVVGREVVTTRTSQIGDATIDVSLIATGIYNVILDHDAAIINIGKIVVIK